MKAMWNGAVIAEASREDLIRIEENWYYPQSMGGSTERVGKNFANYVAFWNGTEVTE